MTTREIFYSILFLGLSAFAALCFTLGTCGCGGAPKPRLVVVSADPPLRRVEALRLVVETAIGERSLPLDVPVAGGPSDVPPDRTVSIDVAKGGRIRVQVEALREGRVVASGIGEGEGEVRVVLPGDALPDLASQDTVIQDAPPNDTSSTTPDAGVDASAPNIDLASLPSHEDLAQPDLRLDDGSRPPSDLSTPTDLSVLPDHSLLSDLLPFTPDLRGCLASLAHVGTGDFTVAFQLANGALGKPSTLLAQRAACDNSKPYWYVGLKPDGGLYALTGGPSGYAGIDSSTSFGDKARRVLLRRRGGSLTVVVDGVTEAGMPSTTSLDALAPLEVGKSTACGTPIVPGVVVDEICLSIP